MLKPFSHQQRIRCRSWILEEIQRRKDLISGGIIHILSTQKLQMRTCRSCKKRLPWNWPYRLCDTCYRRHSGSWR